jgi:hypothetical protein
LLLCLGGAAAADLGAPTIHAVCQIKLANSSSLEDFITLRTAGYEGVSGGGALS